MLPRSGTDIYSEYLLQSIFGVSIAVSRDSVSHLAAFFSSEELISLVNLGRKKILYSSVKKKRYY